jgi:hypothetical protein
VPFSHPRWLTALLLTSACTTSHAEPPAEPPAPGPSVELGTPGGVDGLEFVPFGPDPVLKLETFGQGGTHVLLAARTRGFGIRAYAAFSLTNLDSGAELVAPAPTRPQLFYCHDDVCDLLPVTMMAGGIAGPDEERDGLPVSVGVDVHDDAGLAASDTQHATLSTEDLGLPSRDGGEAGGAGDGGG